MSMQDYTYYEEVKELISNNDFTSAIDLLNKALNLHPDHPDIYHDRAVCLYRIDKKIEALQDMNKSVELQPDYSYRYASRAYVRSGLKDLDGAIEDYKMAIKLDPEDAISHNNLGLLEEQKGYMYEAQERFKVADELMKILKDSEIDTANAIPVEEEIRENPEPPKPEGRKFKAHLSEMGRVFKSRKALGEFVSFLSNGFKIKP